MHALTAATFAAIVALLATPAAMAIEEPRFEVLEKDGGFELREYLPYIVAETRVEAGFEEAGSVAFQRLGVFPVSRLGADDVRLMRGLRLLGRCDDVKEVIYAIRSHRGQQHPLVLQVITSAHA